LASELQSELVMERVGLLDIGVDGTRGVIRIALQPEHLGQRDVRRHPLIELKADDVRTANRRDVLIEHALEVLPRAVLVPQEMQGQPRHSIADQRIAAIRGICGAGGKPLRIRERFTKLPAVEAIDPQPEQCPQPIVDVLEVLGDLRRDRPGGVDFGPRSFRILA
jgi:hypothetical protein